jgi:DNA-binding beta-propeller fold protein YncE
LKETGSVKVGGKNPDAILYDSFTKRVFTFKNSSGNVTAIDAQSEKVIETFMLGGTLEFAATDLKGKIYVNIEDKSSVDVFDSKKLKLITKYDIAPCESPSGMAIDRKNNRLFVVGDNKVMAVLNLTSGKVIKSLPIGEGVDGCAFDPGTNLIFSSNGKTGNITIIKEESPDEFKVIDNVETARGARTITLDEKTHRIFTSALLTSEGSGKPEFGVLVLESNK